MTNLRTTTTLAGGTYPTTRNGIVNLDEQTVTIVKLDGEDDDGEPEWIVETSGVTPVRLRVPEYELSPIPTAPETQVEFVARLMNGNPLAMGMIVQGMEQYAKAVLKAPKKAPEDDTGFVTDKAWRDAAAYILGNIVARDEVEKAAKRQH